ncbi:hypothetical protein O181_030111 [Austropuccinia psidii MF-1]|uniref:Uncharacterized protein n=1 Tax=Austropuccinia psidii MF-1 TaxID=1389203 RepID=A0A9Q3CSC0_9BASI|nr:hypothetical protein [Austropuccinia psidii MF-1]
MWGNISEYHVKGRFCNFKLKALCFHHSHDKKLKSGSNTFQTPYGNHQRLDSQQAASNPSGKAIQEKEESSHYPSHRRTFEPEKEYSDSFRLTSSRPTRLPSGFTPLKHHQLSVLESPFFTVSLEVYFRYPNWPQ